MAHASFAGFDLANFWDDSDYALKQYVEESPSSELIASIEQTLGYKLPAAYIELMQEHNGGIPVNSCFPTDKPTSWADDHVAITGIFGIGRTKTYSLCGELGSQFMLDEWGYPPIGICICDCPSAGHDMVMLDYSACGTQGEPTVVHVDKEDDYAITFLAKNFESFIRGLVNEQVYNTSAEDLQENLARIKNGGFSLLLAELVAKQPEADYGQIIRNLCAKLTIEKQYFALHADELSTLLYDAQFLLYSQAHPVVSEAAFAEVYPNIIALADGKFSTNGYAPDFIEDWFGNGRAVWQIVVDPTGAFTFSEAYERTLRQRLLQYLT